MNKNRSRLASFAKIAGRPVLMIAVALLIATAFLGLSGYDPFAILKGLAQSFTQDIAGTIRWATPMVLAGLAICVTYKANVFNLGLDGQIFVGGAAAAAVALTVPASMNRGVSLILIFAAAMAAGFTFAMIPAFLKIVFNVNEVVSTLLLNFIGQYFVEFLVNGPLRDPVSGTNLNASAQFTENAWLPRLTYLGNTSANVGAYIAAALVVIMAFLFFKTTLGHEIRVVGANREFARYCGINPHAITVKVMGISGAIGGIIGAIEVTAVNRRLYAGFNTDLGFKGIVVSLLANNNPVGVIFSGIFFGALKNGGNNMERLTQVPSAVSSIVEGIVILFISATFVVHKVRKNKKSAAKEVTA